MVMIDYYYEFLKGTNVQGQDIRYGLLRGYHPEDAHPRIHDMHNHCWRIATRVWLENANGMIQVKQGTREIHNRINGREMTWVKLQAQELET